MVDTDDEYQYEEVPIDEIFIGTGKLDIQPSQFNPKVKEKGRGSFLNIIVTC